MARMTHTEPIGYEWPRLGQVVFFHPVRKTENTPAVLPAIVHHIVDGSRGIVDLTVFTPKGPVVHQEVAEALGPVEGRWSRHQS